MLGTIGPERTRLRSLVPHLFLAGGIMAAFYLAGEGLGGCSFGLSLYVAIAIAWARWGQFRSGNLSSSRASLVFEAIFYTAVILLCGSNWLEFRGGRHQD